MNKNKNRIKNEYVNFINTTYNPTHFLTVRLPKHWETENLYYAVGRLRLIMKVFEKSLIKNHWNKHHLPFIATSEKGDGLYWHFHILFNHDKYTNEMLQKAIKKTIKTIKGMSDYCLMLKTIEENDIYTFLQSLNNTNFYCLKEMQINQYGHFDSDKIIHSHNLFYLPYKNK